MSKPFFRTSSVVLSCCTALFGGASALAQEPSCELECIQGFTCEVQLSACPDLPRGDTPCEPTPFPSCVAVPCSSNADCADHLTCYDGDTSDDRPSECVPQHSLACNVDTDCGVGFTCAPLNPCLDPAEPDCVPDAPEDGKVCFITETRACQADSECLPGWTCENNPLNAHWVNTSGESGCNIGDPALVCMPPHSSIFGHGSAGFLDWAKGVERTFTSVPESQCPEPTSSYVPYGRGGGIEEWGSPDAIANHTSEPGPPAVVSDDPNDSTLPPVVPSSGDVPMAQATSSAGGCSLSIAGDRNAGQAAHGLGLALLVGLGGVTMARRRSSARRG